MNNHHNSLLSLLPHILTSPLNNQPTTSPSANPSQAPSKAKSSKAPSDSPTVRTISQPPTRSPSTAPTTLTSSASSDAPPLCLVDGVEADFIDCVDGKLSSDSTKTCQQACLDSGGSCCDDGSGGDACIGFTGELSYLVLL